MSINTLIDLPIHFIDLARGECKCSPQIQREVWEWGIKAMMDARQAEEELFLFERLIVTGEPCLEALDNEAQS